MALTVLDFTIQDAIVGLVGRGVPPVEACARVGISKRSLDAMLRNYPEFRERFDTGIELMIARVKRTIYEHAVDGDAKAWEMFFREWQPHLATQTQSGKQSGSAEPAIQATINVAVVAVRELLMSDQGPKLLDALHTVDAIEVPSDQPDP